MSTGTPVATLPFAAAVEADSLEPYLIEVIVPLDSGTLDAALTAVQDRIDALLTSQSFQDAVMEAVRLGAASLPDQSAGAPTTLGHLYLASELLGLRRT